MPRLSEIVGEIKGLNGRIGGLEKTVESFRNETLARFEAVYSKMDGLEKSMGARLDAIEKRIPVIEDLAEIKVRISELEKKIASMTH